MNRVSLSQLNTDMADTSLITLDKAAQTTIPLTRVDDAGAVVDISQSSITFYVHNGFTLVPTADPGNTKGRLLVFTPAMAQSLGSKAHDFLILFDGNPIRGSIIATGFVPV